MFVDFFKEVFKRLKSQTEIFATAMSIISQAPKIIGETISSVFLIAGNTLAIAIPSIRSIYKTCERNRDFNQEYQANKTDLSIEARNQGFKETPVFIISKLNNLMRHKNYRRNINYALNSIMLLLTIGLDTWGIISIAKKGEKIPNNQMVFQALSFLTATFLLIHYPLHSCTISSMNRAEELSKKIKDEENRSSLKNKLRELSKLYAHEAPDDIKDYSEQSLLNPEDLICAKEKEIISLIF